VTVKTARAIELTGDTSRIARKVSSAHRRLIAGDLGRMPRARLPRTLVACSGGADSSALVVALAHAGFPIAVGHVVHDMRARAAALGDRDLARALAARVGAPFVEAEVRASGKGNTEANARRERYRALGALARESECAFIATAHHADDQLETMVMSLVRGTGPHGLRGIAPVRRIEGGIRVVRPMLEITRTECVDLCAGAGVVFATDATNADLSRFRAALREGALADIRRLRPEASRRAGRTARLMRDLAEMVDACADAVHAAGSGRWTRASLRDQPAIVVGEVLRRGFARETGGIGVDALRGRMIDEAVRITRSRETDPRTLDWPRGVRVVITAREVSILGATPGPGIEPM